MAARAIPVLETERLILRGHRVTDFDASAAMWADPNVVRYISGTPSSRVESWARLLKFAGHWALLGFGYWVAEAKADGRFMGEVGFADYKRDVVPAIDVPEIGWVLCSAEQGQGYATEAVTRLVQWADEAAQFERTACLFDPAHAASLRVAVKVGYGDTEQVLYQGAPALVMSRDRV